MADQPSRGGAKGSAEIVELSSSQQSFARRVAESKATTPHVYFTRRLDSPPELPALIAAVARALRQAPLLNSAYRDGRVESYERVNVAFGVVHEGTLALPVIHDADRKDAGEIGEAIKALTQGVEAGSLASPAFAGATFTIVDMSGTGAASFTPIIASGQAGTLGAGTEYLTLACDNRAVQGTTGAEFLAAIRLGP